MTQVEFTQRTNIEVSYNEFEAINTVYMNSDLDKDEFCKMWCKMNAKRIKKYIAEKKAAEKENELKWELAQIANREYTYEESTQLAKDTFTKKEMKMIEDAGISMEEEIYNPLFNSYHIVPCSVSSIIYSINKYIAA